MKDNHIGAIQVALGAIFWSFAGVLGKWLPWNAFTINGLRSLVAAILLGIARRSFRVRITRGTLLGAVGVTLTSILYMAAMKLTTSANAIVLQYTAPIFILVLSAVFFKQKLIRKEVIVVAITMIGMVLFFFDQLSPGNVLGNIFGILAGLFLALMFVMVGAAIILATVGWWCVEENKSDA